VSKFSDFHSTLTARCIGTVRPIVIHVTDCMHRFKMLKLFSPLLGVRWIGLDVDRNTDTHRGSDWIGSVSLWIGLDRI